MLRHICMVFLFVTLLSTEIYGSPAPTQGKKNCFGFACPPQTVTCFRESRINYEQTEITTRMECWLRYEKPIVSVTRKKTNTLGHWDFTKSTMIGTAYEFENKTLEDNAQDLGDNLTEL